VLGDDAELTAAVLAAQDGDETAFRTVYRAVHPRLLGYVRTLVADPDVEDVTSEAWLQIARDLGIKIVEQQIPRESLYIADEVFFTGTAAEVTPIRSVDKISVGKGVVGPITKSIQQEFYGIVRGEKADRYNWLTPVPVGSKQPVGV